ncbi:PIN domain-containing protein [Methanobrevibacter sp.]|uniref:PIN domain-containing protein n=1 Tax=Methanobrevibacter sp. TaxID=66852 RepID=UPI0038909986
MTTGTEENGMKVYVYIDYENMGKLQSLPPIDGKYFVFIGAEQKSVPTSLVLAQNENQIEWIQISGNGKNALDFHIAYFLAKHDSEKEVMHYILSKDQGFDPLIHFVNQTKGGEECVKRIVTLEDISNDSSTCCNNSKRTDDESFKEKRDIVLKNLKKIKSKPKSENALKKHIQTLSGNDKWNEEIVNDIVEDLYRQRFISKGSNNRISYSV